MKRSKIMTAMLLVSVFTLTNSINSKTTDSKNQEIDMTSLVEIQNDQTIAAINDSIESIKQSLIRDVDMYIRKNSRKSKMDAEHIVNCCLDSNFDIPLLLSQAQQESAFGTAGNRPFGMMNKRYKNPNHAVQPYIDLMNSKYLRTKSVDDALRTGLYINGSRKSRYASDPRYCSMLIQIRKTIRRQTNIFEHQQRYRSLKEKHDSMLKTNRQTAI